MLKSLGSFEQLAYYALAFQMFGVLNFVPNSVLAVVYPAWSNCIRTTGTLPASSAGLLCLGNGRRFRCFGGSLAVCLTRNRLLSGRRVRPPHR